MDGRTHVEKMLADAALEKLDDLRSRTIREVEGQIARDPIKAIRHSYIALGALNMEQRDVDERLSSLLGLIEVQLYWVHKILNHSED